MKVALISDIHANIFALKTVYLDLEKEGVDRILVIGDLIGYYYWPKEVIDILRNDYRVSCVRGNHEEVLEKTLSSNEVASSYRKKYGSGYDVCREELSEEEINWLISLPESMELDVDGCSFYMSHGSLTGVDDYLYPDASLEYIKQNYSASKFTVFGHTHYPFLHTLDNKLLINPGSVGQSRDVGGLASYVIVNTENLTVRFKRLAFDFSKLIETAKCRDPELEYLWKIMNR